MTSKLYGMIVTYCSDCDREYMSPWYSDFVVGTDPEVVKAKALAMYREKVDGDGEYWDGDEYEKESDEDILEQYVMDIEITSV